MDHGDLPQIFRVIAALVFVLGLMGGLVVVLRKLGYASQHGPAKRRLKLIEVLHLDSRHKMALVQRDDKQHLVILGANGDTVVETGITPVTDDEKSAS